MSSGLGKLNQSTCIANGVSKLYCNVLTRLRASVTFNFTIGNGVGFIAQQ